MKGLKFQLTGKKREFHVTRAFSGIPADIEQKWIARISSGMNPADAVPKIPVVTPAPAVAPTALPQPTFGAASFQSPEPNPQVGRYYCSLLIYCTHIIDR